MQEKILIVEDNPQNMRLLEMVLRTEGYIILQASDGEEALRISLEKRPDLIIMDIHLPTISGLEVTKKLREHVEFGHVPIIAVTAYAMKGDREDVLQSGCDAYLSKPINTHVLRELIAETLLKKTAGIAFPF